MRYSILSIVFLLTAIIKGVQMATSVLLLQIHIIAFITRNFNKCSFPLKTNVYKELGVIEAKR